MNQIVRFEQQDFWPKNESDLTNFLNRYGLEKVRIKYSAFGQCYFLEVKGDFIEDDVLYKVNTPVNEFSWIV